MEDIDIKPPVIAVIDDDADLRRTVSALLEESGFAALSLADGEGSFALGPAPDVDLALIDLWLADENGLELAVELRRRFGLPLVILTGRGEKWTGSRHWRPAPTST